MKPTIGGKQIIIGKRVSVGAAILGIANAIAYYLPEHAPAILALATPITLIAQVWIANQYGATQ